MQIYRRDILIIDMKQTPVTSLQTGIRPVLVISNNKANTCLLYTSPSPRDCS